MQAMGETLHALHMQLQAGLSWGCHSDQIMPALTRLPTNCVPLQSGHAQTPKAFPLKIARLLHGSMP